MRNSMILRNDPFVMYSVLFPAEVTLIKKASVFSEKTWHNVCSEPHPWSNPVQLATLWENHGLMMGWPLNDRNLRRLLEIAAWKQAKNSRHDAFIQESNSNHPVDNASNGKIDEVSASKILRTHHVIQEKRLESSGTQVIRSEDYDKIPVLPEMTEK